jgi:hypothetical protein
MNQPAFFFLNTPLSGCCNGVKAACVHFFLLLNNLAAYVAIRF